MKTKITILTILAAFSLTTGCSGSASTPTSTTPPTDTPAPTATQKPTAVPTATPTKPPDPGGTRTDAHGVEQVWVPAGSFVMGTEDIIALDPPSWAIRELESEQPAHEVTLSSGYWIDKYEVTNKAFQKFVDDDGYINEEYWSAEGWGWLAGQDAGELPIHCTLDEHPDHPRVCVTWYEADAYARWRGGRLPTEAEWEYAARGPESLIYPWGNTFDSSKANVLDSDGLTPVGDYPDGVSWVGAFDMAGNAMEWVKDWLDFDYYERNEQYDPGGPETGRIKIEKGGWWGSNPFVARAAYHHFEDPPTYQDHHIGFRIVTPINANE